MLPLRESVGYRGLNEVSEWCKRSSLQKNNHLQQGSDGHSFAFNEKPTGKPLKLDSGTYICIVYSPERSVFITW